MLLASTESTGTPRAGSFFTVGIHTQATFSQVLEVLYQGYPLIKWFLLEVFTVSSRSIVMGFQVAGKWTRFVSSLTFNFWLEVVPLLLPGRWLCCGLSGWTHWLSLLCSW